MYLDELRSFRSWMVYHTGVPELQALNLLGVQFALCEAWLFSYANPNYLHLPRVHQAYISRAQCVITMDT